MRFLLKNIAKKIKTAFLGDEKAGFSFLSTDSRSISNPAETLFIALITPRNDGHKFVAPLYQKGVRCFVVANDNFILGDFPGAGFIIAENTLDALQKIAAFRRSLFKKRVVGITGSNGKTVVKEWLAQLLAPDLSVCRSPKSYNSQIGVPLSVWQLEKKHDLGIFEAGISFPGEMEALENIILPNIGIITNIKASHDENFSSRKQKAEEKLKLFERCESIFFSYDDAEVRAALKDKKFGAIKKISWTKGKAKGPALKILSVKRDGQGASLKARFHSKSCTIRIPFNDDASLENAIHCWLFLLEAGYANEVIEERFMTLSPVAMRLEMKQAVNNSSLVNDSYSSDLASLSIALDFLNRQHQHPKKTVILSDIIQSGKRANELYREVAHLLSSKKTDRLIGIGEEIAAHRRLFKQEKEFYSSTDEFIRAFNPARFSNEAILLKGARQFGFEKIGSLLQQKSHDTVLEINLNNVIHNLNYYRGLLKPGTLTMGMVKAFSYGSGSYEIASALQHHNVNYLAVAYADEGVELRRGGIKTPVMVMNPEPQSFHDLLLYNLEPEIFSHRIFDLFSEFVKEQKRNGKNPPGIHLKLDTGMHRLGFEERDVDALIRKLKSSRHLKVASIFSHLAASDEPELREFTLQQLELFRHLSKKISNALPNKPILHVCNSAAIKRFPEAQLGMVRLGIGMYGIGADAEEQPYLLNAGTWKTTISQIRHLAAGESVGYSRKGLLSKATTIATIPVGYADGFSRKLGNGKGCMYVRGKKAPVVGNVCMDMCMIDITGIPAQEGEEVILFNSPETLQELSRMTDTIPYEVLTSISPRVKRIYIEE